jgi:hypothetical protein
MAVVRALRRLLRIRELEEEQSRVALESAVAELARLERAQGAIAERERRGRQLVFASVGSGDLQDRRAGLHEIDTAQRIALGLAAHLSRAHRDASRLRDEYLVRRVERRQAGTLLEEAEAEAAVRALRQSQQGLDDWFRNRKHRHAPERGPESEPPPF